MQTDLIEARKRLNLLEAKGKTLALRQEIASLQGEVDSVETELRLRQAAVAEVESLDNEFSIWASARTEMINLQDKEIARQKAITLFNAKCQLAFLLALPPGVSLFVDSWWIHEAGMKAIGSIGLVLAMGLMMGAFCALCSQENKEQ
jgi:hypothetical protein